MTTWYRRKDGALVCPFHFALGVAQRAEWAEQVDIHARHQDPPDVCVERKAREEQERRRFEGKELA